MKRVWLLSGLALLTVTAPCLAQLTAIRAGGVVDPESGTTAANQVILVEGERIREIGPELSIPRGATLIDLADYTVLPGLIDVHTHLCLSVKPEREGLNFFVTTLLDPTSYRAIEGVVNARALLEAGFTTVRDLGNTGDYADTQVKRAIEAGIVDGPTIFNAGRIIAPYGGQFYLTPETKDLGEPEYLYADTQDELRKALRANLYFGANVIKVVVDDQPYLYSIEELRYLVEEAAKAGVKVAAHTYTAEGSHRAAAAGVASIEHGQYMRDEDMELAKRNGVALVGTEFLPLSGYGATAREVWIDRLRRAHRSGALLAYGSDVFVGVGVERARLSTEVIEVWLEAGIPAEALLRAMTVNGARVLGIERERGRLEAGMYADIVATAENPLEDPRTLKRVAFVMKNGRVIKQPAARAVSLHGGFRTDSTRAGIQ